MKIRRFEEIEAWQEARSLTRDIYSLTKLKDFNKDWGLSQQIQRAAVSIMSNIAEGFDSGSKAEFIRFLSYARRSSSEVQNHLYVAKDQDYILQENFEGCYEKSEKTRRKIVAFQNYLRSLTR